MTLLHNGADAYTEGGQVGSGGSLGAGENAFNSVNSGTGAVRIATATDALIGTKCFNFQNGATSTANTLNWTTASIGSHAVTYFRTYFKLGASPASTMRFIYWARTAGRAGELCVTTGRKIRAVAYNVATVGETTNSIPLNQWIRLEGRVAHEIAGTIELRMFFNYDETVANEIFTRTGDFRGPAVEMRFGITDAMANTPLLKFDDITFSSDDWIGPAAGYVNDKPTVSLSGSSLIDIGDTADVTATAVDIQGGAMTYAWSFDSKPAGSANDISSQNGDSITFDPDKSGIYVVRTTVTKTVGGKTATATRSISVKGKSSVKVGGIKYPTNMKTKVGGVLKDLQSRVKQS